MCPGDKRENPGSERSSSKAERGITASHRRYKHLSSETSLNAAACSWSISASLRVLLCAFGKRQCFSKCFDRVASRSDFAAMSWLIFGYAGMLATFFAFGLFWAGFMLAVKRLKPKDAVGWLIYWWLIPRLNQQPRFPVGRLLRPSLTCLWPHSISRLANWL